MEDTHDLLNTTDARIWAREFVQLHGGDESLMTTWFASAIETGRRAGYKVGLEAAIDRHPLASWTPPEESK